MSRAPALLISAGEAVDRRLLHARLPGLLLTAGALGDRFGRKRALTFGLVVFALGSALSAVAGSAGMLIASRALMGVGGAFIMPSTLSILTATFPPAVVERVDPGRLLDLVMTGIASRAAGSSP